MVDKKKNKKIAIYIPIILFLVIVGGIFYFFLTNKAEIDKEGGVLTKKDDIITQVVSYEKDGALFKFSKNRLSKTANLDIQYSLADKEEFVDFYGSKVTIAPLLINLLCGTLTRAFFDPTSLEKPSENEDKAKRLIDTTQFKNSLEGYRVSSFKMEFKDKESNEQIAICQSNQKGFENIKFTVVRDYSGYGSFLGQKIGVISNGK